MDFGPHWLLPDKMLQSGIGLKIGACWKNIYFSDVQRYASFHFTDIKIKKKIKI